MARLGNMKLEGTSGAVYRFRIYPWTAKFKAIGAVYFVTRRFANSAGGFHHERIFLGETPDLSKGFDKHLNTDLFRQYSANCVCVYRENEPAQRQKIEQDLLPKHKTLLNT